MIKISCLTRNNFKAILLPALVCIAAGCSTQEKIVYDPVNTRPIVGDRAMALRSDWSKSVCTYANGDVAGWSTRYPYQTDETRMDSANLVLDSLTFIGETAFLPIELVANPLYQPQVWYGVKYPLTYTAQPPLPGRRRHEAIEWMAVHREVWQGPQFRWTVLFKKAHRHGPHASRNLSIHRSKTLCAASKLSLKLRRCRGF